MSSERIPYLYIAVGTKGSGKSYMSKKSIMDNYIKPKSENGQYKPVLIFDTNDEFQDIPDLMFDITCTKDSDDENSKKRILDGKKCATFVTEFCTKSYRGQIKPQIMRILPLKPNREEMTIAEKTQTAEVLLKYFKGGLLVLEDMNSYMMGARSTNVIGMITTNRHRNQDILIHLQSLSALDPRLWQNVNIIRMHREATDYSKITQKIKTDPAIFEIAKEIVDRAYSSGDPYKFVYVYPQTYEIYGCTDEEFESACMDYLGKNPRKLKERLSRENVNSGEKKGRDEQIREFIQEKKKWIMK